MTHCPARYDETLGMWVVDEPEEVREILLDPATFRPDNAVLAHTALSVKALRVLQGAGFALPPMLANNAGASHRPIRAAVARFFSPARVAAVEPLTRGWSRSGSSWRAPRWRPARSIWWRWSPPAGCLVRICSAYWCGWG